LYEDGNVPCSKDKLANRAIISPKMSGNSFINEAGMTSVGENLRAILDITELTSSGATVRKESRTSPSCFGSVEQKFDIPAILTAIVALILLILLMKKFPTAMQNSVDPLIDC